MVNKPWYNFHDGDFIEVTLQSGEVFKYMHVGRTETGQAMVEIEGVVKTVNEVFQGKNIEKSKVRKIECSES